MVGDMCQYCIRSEKQNGNMYDLLSTNLAEGEDDLVHV